MERQRAVLEMILNSGSSVSVGIPCCVRESSMFTKPTLLIHFEIPDAHVTHALRLTSHSSLTESASKRDVVERRGPRCLSIVVIEQRLLFIICSFPPDSDQLPAGHTWPDEPERLPAMRVGFVHAALAIAAEPRIPANWARSAARISCTASLRPWRCLTVGGQGDHRNWHLG